MNKRITEYAKALDQVTRQRRRDFHRYAETAWMEMRTSAIINQILTELGYEVVTGRALCLEEARIGVPPAEELKEHAKLALSQGAPTEYLTEDMKEGFTGVMGILRCGQGPVVALRFDIDALGLIEKEEESHRPYREGFSSQNRGMMHACGHDGHGAIGLGVAEVLMKLKDELHGTIKLIFQPGEEGAKGARAIVAHGHLDDVDYFVGTHIAPSGGPDDGDVTPGTWGSLATSKYDAHFYGQAAHAGGFPEKGRSAIVAAANAVLNLTAIPRHSDGISRVNVGTIQGGTGRNVVADHAVIQFEVRGETTEINRYMDEEAVRICNGAAQMNGCSCSLILQGGAESQHSDEDFLERIAGIVERELPHLRVSSCKNARNWGSEDISLMMNRVQEHGGKATYMRSVTPMASAQHTTAFDFDEKVLVEGIEVFTAIVWDLCGNNMTYTFYGWNHGDVPPVTDEYKGIHTPRQLYDALSDIWCEYTCAPRLREKWSRENRTAGQCSITAFLAQDIFGGKVYGIPLPGGNYHCYNVVGDCVFDLTSEQFPGEVLNYENNPEQFREDHFAREEKRQRYEYLKEQLKKRQEKIG